MDEGEQAVYPKLRVCPSTYASWFHTACEVQALVEMVRFFAVLILNTDESEDI